MCSWPHPYSTPILGCSRCTRSPMLGVNERMGLKLFGREIIFEEFQPIWSRYLNVTAILSLILSLTLPDLNQIADLKLSILAPVKFRSPKLNLTLSGLRDVDVHAIGKYSPQPVLEPLITYSDILRKKCRNTNTQPIWNAIRKCHAHQ